MTTRLLLSLVLGLCWMVPSAGADQWTTSRHSVKESAEWQETLGRQIVLDARGWKHWPRSYQEYYMPYNQATGVYDIAEVPDPCLTKMERAMRNAEDYYAGIISLFRQVADNIAINKEQYEILHKATVGHAKLWADAKTCWRVP